LNFNSTSGGLAKQRPVSVTEALCTNSKAPWKDFTDAHRHAPHKATFVRVGEFVSPESKTAGLLSKPGRCELTCVTA
jgi:hypothetical protein